MEYQERKAAVVLLADGTRFYGKSIGITGTSQVKYVLTQE